MPGQSAEVTTDLVESVGKVAEVDRHGALHFEDVVDVLERADPRHQLVVECGHKACDLVRADFEDERVAVRVACECALGRWQHLLLWARIGRATRGCATQGRVVG